SRPADTTLWSVRLISRMSTFIAYLLRGYGLERAIDSDSWYKVDDRMVARATSMDEGCSSPDITSTGAALSRRLLRRRRWRSDSNNIGELAETVLPSGWELPPGPATRSPSNWKLKMISPVTITGTPDR